MTKIGSLVGRFIILVLLLLLLSILLHSVLALGERPPFRQELLNNVATEQFGSCVANTLDGSRLAIGAIVGEKAYVYDRNSSGFWVQSETLSGSGSYFGKTIGISSNGDLIAIGASGYSPPGFTSTGAVFIFEFEDSSWTNTFIVTELLLSSHTGICFLQLTISNDGNTIVCERGNDVSNGRGVDVFFNNGTAWEQQGPPIIGPPDGNNYVSGLALSGDGSVLVLGLGYTTGTGNVYVYARNDSGIWSPFGGSGSINAPQSASLFGLRVEISADASVIGVQSNLGSPFFIFVLSGQMYTLSQTINPPTGSSATFGRAFVMSPSGNRIVIGDIGANYETSPVKVIYGGAFIFDRFTSLDNFTFTGQINSTLLERGGAASSFQTSFGYAISLTEDDIFVGAHYNANGQGELTLFDVTRCCNYLCISPDSCTV